MALRRSRWGYGARFLVARSLVAHNGASLTVKAIAGLGAAMALLGLMCGAVQAQGRLVFAHYMVCCPRGLIDPAESPVPTVESFLEDIREAHRVGIDGFALNCGEWNSNSHYRPNSAMLFEAARRFGPDFKLFFSADSITADEAADMVVTYGGHPNQLQHDGRPVLSSFAGNDDWARAVRAKIRERSGGEVFLVPFFYPSSKRESPTLRDITTLVSSSPDIDGFFYFGSAGTPDDLARAIRLNAGEWSKRGKLFMAGIAAYYRGVGVNYRAFENGGYAGLEEQWMAAIESDTTWVELVTWNDWGETYLSPLSPSHGSLAWRDVWGYLLPHDGYLDANAYFIDWFKSGRQPPIERDRLFYAYRLHRRSVPGRPVPTKPDTALPRGAWTLSDQVHVLAFLRAPASLSVRIGTHAELISLPAGVNQRALPMADGEVSFELARGGIVLGSKTAEFPIAGNDSWSNFNILAGEVPLDDGDAASARPAR